MFLSPFVFCTAFAAAADSTADFLKPDNWEGRADIWKIEGGSIVGETKEDPKYNTFFCTKAKYADFEMTCKVELRDAVGNSGVQIRSTLKDAKKFVVAGPQVDIGKGYWGSLYGEGFGGMMKATTKEQIAKAVKEKEWNEYRIVAKGKKVTVVVNGETMIDQEFEKMPAEGIIALQCHAGYPKMRVEFKEIKFTVPK